MRRIHRIPCNTSRGSRQGRPPFCVVPRRSGPGTNFLIASHWSSVRSITHDKHFSSQMETPSKSWSDFDQLHVTGYEMRSSGVSPVVFGATGS